MATRPDLNIFKLVHHFFLIAVSITLTTFLNATLA
jgi:hypothetical protein